MAAWPRWAAAAASWASQSAWASVMRPEAESASACSERSVMLCGARAHAVSSALTSPLSCADDEADPTVDAAARRHMMSSACSREA